MGATRVDVVPRIVNQLSVEAIMKTQMVKYINIVGSYNYQVPNLKCQVPNLSSRNPENQNLKSSMQNPSSRMKLGNEARNN
jgi:PHP family Zn ribbon phosphoesterase